MTGDQRHIFIAVKDNGRSLDKSVEHDRCSELVHTCRRYLPNWMAASVVSSSDTLECSIFRHSTAPYWPDFDPFAPRILLKLSFIPDTAPEMPPLQEVTALADCVLKIAEHQPVDALCWPHAQLISQVTQLRMAMERLAEHKDAPVLQFVRMSVRPDQVLTSAGLYYFCGQEIRLRAIGALSAAGLVRRACRVAADAMLNGAFEKPITVPGLAEGEHVRIRPEPHGIWNRRIRWLSVECDVRQAVLSGMDL